MVVDCVAPNIAIEQSNGGSLTIRPVCRSDAHGIALAGRDDAIRDLPWFGRAFDDSWAPDWVERAMAQWEDGKSRIFSILDAGSAYVGSVVLLSGRDDRKELAYWILPERRGHGAATAAVRAVLD